MFRSRRDVIMTGLCHFGTDGQTDRPTTNRQTDTERQWKTQTDTPTVQLTNRLDHVGMGNWDNVQLYPNLIVCFGNSYGYEERRERRCHPDEKSYSYFPIFDPMHGTLSVTLSVCWSV